MWGAWPGGWLIQLSPQAAYCRVGLLSAEGVGRCFCQLFVVWGNELRKCGPTLAPAGHLGPADLGDPVGLNAAMDANGSLSCGHSGSSQELC